MEDEIELIENYNIIEIKINRINENIKKYTSLIDINLSPQDFIIDNFEEKLGTQLEKYASNLELDLSKPVFTQYDNSEIFISNLLKIFYKLNKEENEIFNNKIKLIIENIPDNILVRLCSASNDVLSSNNKK